MGEWRALDTGSDSDTDADAGAHDEDEEMRAVDGRVPGRRGRATRRRLLDQTAELLETSSYRDLKVIDIAREAGTSPATFYQYFADVESAVLALAEEMAVSGSRLAVIVREGSWRGRRAYESAEALVDGFLDFWSTNTSVLRVVDLATAEGDARFHRLRTHLLNQVTNELAAIIGRLRDDGRHPGHLDPMAQAGVLVAMLAHVAGHQTGFAFWGVRPADLRTSLARQLSWGVTGQKPPS